jgi:hypothetical protein
MAAVSGELTDIQKHQLSSEELWLTDAWWRSKLSLGWPDLSAR